MIEGVVSWDDETDRPTAHIRDFPFSQSCSGNTDSEEEVPSMISSFLDVADELEDVEAREPGHAARTTR
jgi:hypothetical protein